MIQKLWKQTPLFFAITVAAVVFTVCGALGRAAAYRDYRFELRRTPVMALFFLGLHDGKLPLSGADFDVFAQEEAAAPRQGGRKVLPGNETAQDGEETVVLLTPEQIALARAAREHLAGRVALLQSPEETLRADEYFDTLPELADGFANVDATYFADALFIGDSRTVGLATYVPELDAQATFYAKTSMTVAHIMEQTFQDPALGNVTIAEALMQKSFSKIYLNLGVNELGNGTTQAFVYNYQSVINELRTLAPDAIIYIVSIMHVTAAKDAEGSYVNNLVINERNRALSVLADNDTVFYIDMNEAVDDAAGTLDETLTFDGVHLKAVSYDLWYRFLTEHAVL